MLDNLNLADIEAIKNITNNTKIQLFDSHEWRMNHLLTEGDIFLVIEAYLNYTKRKEIRNE